MRVKITIIGKVHNVEYKLFLLDLAESLFIERFYALDWPIDGKQAVVVLIEGEEEQIKQFLKFINERKPENAIIEEIRVEEFNRPVVPIERYKKTLMVILLNEIIKIGL